MHQQHYKNSKSHRYSIPDEIFKEDDCYVSSKDLSKMALIPEGFFVMGVKDEDIFAKPHEKPQRPVKLSPYLIDIFPITNEQFGKFMDEGGYKERRYWSPEGWQHRIEENIDKPLAWEVEGWDRPKQPVAGVNWYEAEAYAKWANKQLPTEAQWEKASRGTDSRRYPWGNDFPTTKAANFNNKVGCTTNVGTYEDGISHFGCYDMSGNVNNWCRDWYWDDFYTYCVKNYLNTDPVLDNTLKNKIGLDLQLKVDRGGGFATSREFWEILSCTDKSFLAAAGKGTLEWVPH